MKTQRIAHVCFTALAALGAFFGDEVLADDYGSLTAEERDKFDSGVQFLLDNHEAGPDARHNIWMEARIEDGWKKGTKIDEENKTHPRLVEFGDLPKKEQFKEQMLHDLVRTLDEIIDEQTAAPEQAAPAVTLGDTVKVKFIGKKEEHKDSKYGTNLVWKPGQVHSVPGAVAARMLKHTDTYEIDGGAVQSLSIPAVEPAKTPEKLPTPLPNLEGMNKQELITFAQQYYGEHFSEEMAEVDMRSQIHGYIMARGR